MKILVAVKRVIDPYVKIRVKSDNSAVETQHVKMSMNPFDEIALEEAVRLLDKGIASEVVVVSIGDDTAQETLRQGLALGADRAIHIQSHESYISLNIAKILKAVIEREKPSLVLLGKQSIDGDNNQTAQMLAALLAWPQAMFASKITILNNVAEVTREVDAGLETLSLNLPAIISTDLRLNEPRYASLPNIMKAKRKPLEQLTVADLSLTLKSHTEVLKVAAPSTRSGGMILDSVASLVDKLKNEVKVLA